MDIEKQKNFILRFVFWLLIGGIVYVVLKYALPLLVPFLIGAAVAVLLKPISERLSAATGLNRKHLSGGILLLFYAAMIAILVLIGAKLTAQVRNFFTAVPELYLDTLAPALSKLLQDMTHMLDQLDPSLQDTLQSQAGNVISSLANIVTAFSAAVLNWLTGFAGGLPLFLIGLVIAMISSFFILDDYPMIRAFILRQIKPGHMQLMELIRDNAVCVLVKYVKVYFMLMVLTFIELVIGLWLIGVSNAGLIALGIAFFDLLPVLGTGGILVPWGIIDLIIGNVGRGIKILVLYAIVTMIRNVLEPKVVGKEIGLHPLITLLCMYVGAMLFGFVGFLAFPIAATVINDLNDNGTIHLYKR